jgi:GntR family transcriptional regulator/GntR family frlABCD operon transcriptional regulator
MQAKETPQYRKLYEQLRRHIVNSIYKKGDILPSENELCAVNNVTRPTVRKALDMLANDGFIKKHQGLGSVVCELPKGIGILSISGTTSAIGSERLKTSTLIKPIVKPWPKNFSFELSEIELESGCIYFERLRFVNDIPIFYDISYIPNINLPRFTQLKLENASLFDILRENYQIEIKGGTQYIKAIKADQDICNHLKVSVDQPILNLERKIETSRINFNLYSILFCNTESHALYGKF